MQTKTSLAGQPGKDLDDDDGGDDEDNDGGGGGGGIDDDCGIDFGSYVIHMLFIVVHMTTGDLGPKTS